MASVDARPFPPGTYPAVIIGSGPGGLQSSYTLSRLGVSHAMLSRDEAPGGMFQRYPIFDRLISWTKPHAPVSPTSREYEWFDWNSLLVTDPADRVGVAEFMDGTSEFPSRGEMERSLVAFAERSGIQVRYGCRWESTRKDGEDFVITTSDGEYRTRVAIFAIGMSEPWKPSDIPGIEHVPHYMELRPREEYAGKSLYILGKATSAFEVADGLLPWVRSMVLSSPHGVRLSVIKRSLAGLRARYMQPLEDHAVGGRTVMLFDAVTDRIERTAAGYRVSLKGTSEPWNLTLDFDEAVVATGVSTPLLDLPELGVTSYYRGGRLPALTAFWESASVPGIYFAGSNTQGGVGLRGNTGAGAVHAFRYNARILAEQIAVTRFGARIEKPTMAPDEVVPYLLREATSGPELWNQRSYLGRVISFDEQRGIIDEGITPLAHFVDSTGPDAVGVGIVPDADGSPGAGIYLRVGQNVTEHLLGASPLLDFTTPDNEAELASLLKSQLAGSR